MGLPIHDPGEWADAALSLLRAAKWPFIILLGIWILSKYGALSALFEAVGKIFGRRPKSGD